MQLGVKGVLHVLPRDNNTAHFDSIQSLTCGTGFYSSKIHETVWKGRKLVLRDKETGEFIYIMIG